MSTSAAVALSNKGKKKGFKAASVNDPTFLTKLIISFVCYHLISETLTSYVLTSLRQPGDEAMFFDAYMYMYI